MTQTYSTTPTTKKLPHILALVTVTIWGLTFISTKVLLQSFAPVEILFYRFLLGFLALCFIRSHILHVAKARHHALFAAAGLLGACLYFLLENIALELASAGNVSIVVATAPMFTGIIATFVLRQHSLTRNFVVGFIVAMAGIVLTSFADVSTAQVGLGDVLAVAAAVAWAGYSNIINQLSTLGYETIAITKRCFAWGLVFILIAMIVFGANGNVGALLDPVNIGNLAFLGLGASAGCFAMWGYAVEQLGATRASAYIYLSPGITVIAGVVILGEAFTWMIGLGLVLVTAGLIISERK